jgi:hypothetical protein
VHANQFVAAITQTVGGLPIDIENSHLIVEQKKGVCRVVDKCAETRLARAQLALCLPLWRRRPDLQVLLLAGESRSGEQARREN